MISKDMLLLFNNHQVFEICRNQKLKNVLFVLEYEVSVMIRESSLIAFWDLFPGNKGWRADIYMIKAYMNAQ